MGNKGCCNNVPVTGEGEQYRITHPKRLSDTNPDSKTILDQAPTLSPLIIEMLERLKPFQHQMPKQLLPIIINGQFYEGELDSDDRANGYGRLYKQNGSLFVGKFKDGKVKDNEQGYYFNPDGSHYFGKFLNNEAHDDQGKYFSGSFTYKGGFKNNKFNGHGQEQSLDYSFQGLYENDLRKQGTLIWIDNDIQFKYIGPFNIYEKFQGKGQLYQPTGKYVGQFKNGQKHGKGEYVYRSKIKYVGDYQNGLKNGYGIIYNADNTISYQGQWRNGLPNGKGLTHGKNGKIIQSQFLQGIDVKYIGEDSINMLKKKSTKIQQPGDRNPSIVYQQ